MRENAYNATTSDHILCFEYCLIIVGKLVLGNNSQESQHKFQHRIPEKIVSGQVIYPSRVQRNGYGIKIEPTGVPGNHKIRGLDSLYGRAIHPEPKYPSEVQSCKKGNSIVQKGIGPWYRGSILFRHFYRSIILTIRFLILFLT